MADPGSSPKLILRPLSPLRGDEPIPPFPLETAGPHIVGRATESSWTVGDLAVSRRHALLEQLGGDWYVADLGSRYGTFLNGQRLRGQERMPLRAGDELRFGDWACRCSGREPSGTQCTTALDDPAHRSEVRLISGESLAGVAQVRLEALISASRELEGLADRVQIAQVLARCASKGTNCKRAVVARQVGECDFEILASTEPGVEPKLSRSLLLAASAGKLVQLSEEFGKGEGGHSLIALNIRSAICAPILVGEGPGAFLYLDTRGAEQMLSSDSAAFCRALAQVGGLALERLVAAEIDARRAQLERDLSAARRAQELLMPQPLGRGPGMRYAFESRAGRLVAGDLLDIMQLPDGRTAFFLGDVSGKGIGAAVLMAAAQSKLQTLLLQSVGLTESLENLNADLFMRIEEGRFITLIAGIIDPRRRVVELADAGHGLCCLCSEPAAPQRLELEGGFPIGVVEGSTYSAREFPLEVGSRVVAFSDGLVEQPDAEGRQYGFDAALAVLGTSERPESDVRLLFESVERHAAGPLADDLTVVSLQACSDVT